MRSRPIAAAVAAVVLSAGLSCCSSATDTYCSTLRDDQKQIKALSGKAGASGQTSLTSSLHVFEQLRDAAPDDIADEWDTLVTALQDLLDAVRASGAELSAFRNGRRPAGVTTGQFRAVQQAAAELSTTRVQQAGASIEQHALDVCKVDLGGGLGTPDAS